ncbi:ArnT family glycosyltransferase [Hymenobacter cellulosilyticus]|uniref:Glycosyltransferase family 39 protein n=1 Tax=Hymenobacter cellulosilyticus TaxID=2932248 RepID=A0A8T9Q185_9BACT|nr:glycosyltransferase family 39 protein [Hymenobacter cellulosilyticus]UOQ70662.1 glycosyltransferase family 39 protein [Hymenobacter cellulosilyticus]
MDYSLTAPARQTGPLPAFELPHNTRSYWYWAAGALLTLGVLLRLFQFFDNRSLWIDETFLANSLIRRDFLALSQPNLEYEQKAPILFLWACRLAVLLFGKGEMALRLVPLLCGLASLGIFWQVARTFLKPVGVVVAVGILALAPPLVYHSVEAKQYSSELLGTVLALWLYTRLHHRPDLRSRLLWGLGGASLVWFSYAVIFVLLGMAGGISLYYLLTRQGKLLGRYVLPFGLWILSFGLNYYFFTGRYTESLWLVHWFGARHAFLPLHLSADSGKWTLFSLYMLLDYPLGLFWEPVVGGAPCPGQCFGLCRCCAGWWDWSSYSGATKSWCWCYCSRCC